MEGYHQPSGAPTLGVKWKIHKARSVGSHIRMSSRRAAEDVYQADPRGQKGQHASGSRESSSPGLEKENGPEMERE